MGFLERKRLGLTVRQLREMLAEIEYRDEMSREELAAELVVRLHDTVPGDVRDIDWDKVLDFIIRILPLLLALL